MLKLTYKAEVLHIDNCTALLFSQKEYVDFLNHYNTFLNLMKVCAIDSEFADTLTKMVIVHEMKNKA